MNDYEDIEFARLDDICAMFTSRWSLFGEWIVWVFIGILFFGTLVQIPISGWSRTSSRCLASCISMAFCWWGSFSWREENRFERRRKKICNILDISPIKDGMTLPDGTTIPAVPFHPKEMFFLGKICEFGPQTPEEHTFVNQWPSLRRKDWDCYTPVEARKKYRKYVIKYQQQMNQIEKNFRSSTSSRIKTTSLENAFIFYSLAAKSESGLPEKYKAVIETFSRFYATIPVFPPALLKLSEFYKLGLGCKQDKEKSEKLFQQWLAIIKKGALAGNDEMKRYLFSYYVAHPQEHLNDIINFALKGEVEMKRCLFSYYVAHPQEHLNGIINFALKGEVEMIQLLVNYYSQIGDIDHCNYWASRLR